MRITEFQINNYKSFEETPRIALSAGSNLVVGANNSGKTAILEALALRIQNKPHLSLSQPRSIPHDSTSSINVIFKFECTEIRKIFKLTELMLSIPLYDPAMRPDVLQKSLFNIFEGDVLEFSAQIEGNGRISATNFPYIDREHRTGNLKYYSVRTEKEHDKYIIHSVASGNADFRLKIIETFSSNVYLFRSERLNLSTSSFGENEKLSGDARNLAEVLNILQGNKYRFEELEDHVKRIFPSIQGISLRPSKSGGHLGSGPVKLLVRGVEG